MKNKVSIVIPVYNEEGSIVQLIKNIKSVINSQNIKLKELIIVDDGSNDATNNKIFAVAKYDKKIKLITLRKNLGKSHALQTGFQFASGNFIITMDADLQDDPKELSRFIDKIESGYDLVSGWKKSRHDPWFSKTFPSRCFNLIISVIFKIKIHDINCGYKAYRKEVLDNIRLYGEMHRFTPILAQYYGYITTEIPITHHSRKYGKSKYGISRYYKGLIDLTTVFFITKFLTKPSHIIGGFGWVLGMLGGIGLFYLLSLWLAGYRPIGDRPLFLFSILLVITSVQLVSLGLLAELINKTTNNQSTEMFIKNMINISTKKS